MNTNEDTITKAVVTQRDDGYISVAYLNAEGRRLCRFSSYSWDDIGRSLKSIEDYFGPIEKVDTCGECSSPLDGGHCEACYVRQYERGEV